MGYTIPHVCGVKRSIYCTLLSVWAIVMFAVMGGLLTIRSLAFIEDLEVEEFDSNHQTLDNFYIEQDLRYDTAANNCWIALVMYAATFVVSSYHWIVYKRQGLL